MPMLDIDGTSLYYNVKGNGIPIVFIHPPVLTGSNFKYQLEGLSQNFKVITFDIRGHGRSQYSDIPIIYSLIVEDIKRLLDHLNIQKAVICGYSTGGSVALEYLLNASDRALGGIVISGMSEVKDRELKQKISLAISLANNKAVPLLALAISYGNSNSLKLFNTLFNEALTGDSINIEQYFRYSLHYNCTNQLKNIPLPVLLVYGKKDKQFHYYAKLLHENLPYNELQVINYAKHQIPTKSANNLNQLITHFIETTMNEVAGKH
ncbi:alpha/beta hydrolase [Peribacillus asahii]|uniref:Alpha/beta hydrolase n=1 Tax=Peribacillus asahii TaxID=228899 RepID=A0A398B8P8_9BACI|nr:alpha/beta hydrolase [Peribacillus asahii]RID84076.1 alpha/beta hydrolase [Peribacillus asahii]